MLDSSCAIAHQNKPSIGHKLKLMSFNIQVATASTRARHYLTHSWKHILPHAQAFDNLDRIAQLISGYDFVGLQEVDGGSLRSQFVNQVEYLAEHARFPFWHSQTNRNLGKLAKHSNGMVSRFQPSEITEYKLPGMMPGRGALMVRFGQREHSFALFLVHLALGQRAREYQLDFISELINEHPHACLMGDFNCMVESKEMAQLFRKTDLGSPEEKHLTFPSWRPVRNIDHILITSALEVNEIKVVNQALSDHLPIAMEISLPAEIKLIG